MKSFIEIINVLREAKSEGRHVPDPSIFLWIPGSVADAPSVYPNGIKTLLANGLSKFSIKSNLVFSNGPKSLTKNSPDYPILCSWVFYYFILADESFAKALQSFEHCALVNNNLCGKLFSSL